MALIWMDGFDHYGTGAAGGAAMLDGVWAELSTNGAPSTTNPRTGAAAFGNATVAPSLNAVHRRVLGGAKAAVGLGMAIWLNNLPVVVQGLYLFQFRDAGNTPQVTIICDTTGTISAYRGTTTTLLGTSASAAIVAGAYQHVEAKVVFDNVAGSVEVRVNGVTVLSLTGVDTVATASVECSQICVMNTRSASTTNITGWFFDDVFAWDTSGTENNDFLGDRRVRTLFPDGNTASAGWTAVGAATGYECIDEAVPDEETTYIEAAGGTTPTSEFTLTDLPSVGAIAAVEVVTRSRKTNAGVANLQTSMVSGASVDVGADRPLTEVYTYRSDVSELDPATGVPWTQAAVNAAKLRIARTA